MHLRTRVAELSTQAGLAASKRLGSYCQGVRVRDWTGYLLISALGYFLGASLIGWTDYITFLTVVVTSSLFLAFAFLINNCYDIKSDVNQSTKLSKNPIASGKMSQDEGIVLSCCLAGLGLIIALSGLDLLSKVVYVFLITWGGTYSVPPVRLKGVPVVDVVSHGLALGSGLFLYGFLAASGGSMTLQGFLVAISLFVYSMILEVRNHISDLEADLISSTRTTVCWLGKRKSEQMLSLLTLLHTGALCALAYFTFQSFLLFFECVLFGSVVVLLIGDSDNGKGADMMSTMIYGLPAVSKVLTLILSFL